MDGTWSHRRVAGVLVAVAALLVSAVIPGLAAAGDVPPTSSALGGCWHRSVLQRRTQRTSTAQCTSTSRRARRGWIRRL